jgi:hypothetical protein
MISTISKKSSVSWANFLVRGALVVVDGTDSTGFGGKSEALEVPIHSISLGVQCSFEHATQSGEVADRIHDKKQFFVPQATASPKHPAHGTPSEGYASVSF